MTDYFSLLQQPRRPWLDPEALRSAFLRLSAASHPDKVHHLDTTARQQAQEQFAALNTAFQRLSNTKDRLQHLLELERGAKPAELHEVPPPLANLAMSCGQLCRQADRLIEENQQTRSPLLKLQLFPRTQQVSERLLAQQERLRSLLAELDKELVELDRRWAEAASSEPKPLLVEDLLPIYRNLSLLIRWLAQLQERLVRLSF